ncbi:MAG: hypothetical protein V1934_05655 [Methanobacteriota archaeon]
MTTLREEMHTALDYRINELKKRGMNFDIVEMGTLMSEVKIEGKFLRISLMTPAETVSLDEMKSLLKGKNKTKR